MHQFCLMCWYAMELLVGDDKLMVTFLLALYNTIINFIYCICFFDLNNLIVNKSLVIMVKNTDRGGSIVPDSSGVGGF